ncbi:hypothetical protein CSKR_114470 [Clonorchis sinensis]|uniref:Apple domain-containing protein n=1 Tax=Clonorchis sinensis TaxID=79923 RepID=A0A419QAI4_CLOSI|nr:hypothetical protein CSKR_114470 [Clonorchis sinensis]
MFYRTHIILVLLPILSRGRCPPEYTQLSADVCMIQLGAANEFCKACALCSNYGKQRNQVAFLQGRNVNLLKSVLQTGSAVWTGMHGLLGIPKSPSVAGWRDLDPRTPEFTSGPDLFKWAPNQPTGSEPHLVFHKHHEVMYDIYSPPLNFTREVYCEYGEAVPKTDFNVLYRADFPDKFNSIVQPQPDLDGCTLMVKARTKIDCARRCTLDTACRSIYFNENERKCIHMQHADSLLPQKITESQEGWSRFARTAYGNP